MQTLGNTPLDINNFRLLALYTDIRLFDTEIREAGRRIALSSSGRGSSIKKADKGSMLSDLVNKRTMLENYSKS